MAEQNLKAVATTSVLWNGLQKYTMLGISFISSIILARLLTPYDYGCIGMLEIFIAISTIMIDGGFGSALLQKKRPTQEDYSTIFYWNLAMSTVMYLLLFVSAPFIAKFYKIPLLASVLRVQGIVLFVNALKMIQSNILRKNFRFKPMAIVVTSSSIVSILVTIIMAYCGCGVWSLVAQNILISFLPMVAFWFITKWKPLLIFSKKSFKELFSFGGFMFLTEVIDTLSINLQGLLIGRVYNPATMGYYAKAKTTESLASNGISQVVSTVTYQLYAEVQDDFTMLINFLKRITTTLAYVTFPLIISLMILAKPLFFILYSDRWLPSVPYFQILAVAGFAICLQTVSIQAIAAIGRSKTMFTWTLIKRSLGIILIVGGLASFGMTGLLVGMVLNSWIAFFINAWLVSKHIGYQMSVQIKDLLPIFILAIASFGVSYLTGFFVNVNLYVDSLAKFLVFITLYFSTSYFLKLDAFVYCKSFIPMFVNKIKKRK